MNKNLKKVISTVAALAVSASSFVALAAQSFPDVAETATYAQAVDELVALGVVNGYTDGTFGPDKAVTRAEITKMIVVALGQGSTGEATTGQNTEFTDVPGTHWASGYVSVGTSQGFINGMGDGTFAPDATVQYAQAVKMLVSACGYGTAATNAGGYPSGYMSIASQNSMLTGISDVSNTTELNRGQVAQLIDNAMKMPLTLTTGRFDYDAWGNAYPETEVYDGEGDDYQTLLTKYHDTYVVYGRVVNTSKSSSAVDSDEVQFRVEKADNFDGDYYNKEEGPEEIMKKGSTNADEYLFSYAQALVQKNDDDDYVILSITASAKSKTIEFDADDYDEYTVGSNNDTITVYTNDAHTKTSSYKVDSGATLYINGVEFSGTLESGLKNYVENNSNGTVTLIDQTEAGSTSTDGYYDKIMVTYYVDAVFDQITTTSSYTRLQFSSYNPEDINKAYLEIDEDDDDVTYDFTLGGLTGDTIAYTDLQQDDVLSIAYDVNSDFDASDFYDVYVSRNVASGKITGSDDDDGTPVYTIDGTDYEPSALGSYNGDDLEVGTEYTLYLNIFGKFADYEEGSGSVDDIAILDSFFRSNSGTYKAIVIRADGKSYEYELKEQSGSTLTEFSQIVYAGSDGTYLADNNNGKNPVQNRVVEIKVNSSSKISLKDTLSYKTGGTSEEYKSSSSRIGSIKIDDSTVLMDLTNYDDDDSYGLMSKSSLTNETDYEAYGYSRNSEGIYRYVLILSGANDVNGESDMAVLISQGKTSIDGDETDRLKVVVDGDEKYLTVDPDEDPSVPTAEGTPFFYTLTAEGYIDDIYPVLKDSTTNKYDYSDYSSFVDYVFGLDSFDNVIVDEYVENSNGLASGFGSDSDEARVAFGPVVDRSSSMVQLASDTEEISGNMYSYMEESDREFSIDSNTRVTTFAMEAKSSSRVEAGAASSVLNSTISSNDKYDIVNGTPDQNKSGNYVNWSSILDDDDYGSAINFALVKEFEDDATDILVFVEK